MTRIHLVELPPAKVTAYWPKLEPEIVIACSYSDGLYSPSTVKAKALEGKFQIWAAFTDEPRELKAVGVTCISKYPTGHTVGELLLVAGVDRHSWLIFDEDLAEWARQRGCDRLRCIGRRGWAKTLPRTWSVAATMYDRDLYPRAEAAAS